MYVGKIAVPGEILRKPGALDGHDPAGEAFVAFQRALKSLKNRGVLLLAGLTFRLGG